MKLAPGKLSFITKLGYGVGNLSFGLVLQMITGYLMFYAMHILRMPGKLVGFISAVAVVWDAVTDPIMGYISDHTYFKRFGRRHAYLLWGCVITAVFGYLLWRIDPGMSSRMRFYALLFTLLMCRTGMTVYAVPYNALAAELTLNYHERTSVQSYKTFFFVLGLILSSVLAMRVIFAPTPQYPQGQLNPAAYETMGIVCGAAVLLFGLPSFFATRSYATFAKRGEGKRKLHNVFAELFSTFQNKPFRQVALGYLLINLASAWVGGLALNAFTFSLSYSTADISTVMGMLFLCAILAQPLWLAIDKRRDKRTALLCAVAVGIAGSLAFTLVMLFFREQVASRMVYILPFMLVVGSGIGGMLSIPPSMVADAALIQQRKTGTRMEGTFFGSFTLAYKIAQSLCMLLLGVVLDWVQFQEDVPQQSVQTRFWLGLLLPLGCLIFFTLAYFAYRRYSLKREDVEEARAWIVANDAAQVHPRKKAKKTGATNHKPWRRR